MNVVKKIVLLLGAILFACVASCFGAACSKPEANWATYHNPKYGYTIDYPRDWDLETSEAPQSISIWHPTAFAVISISVVEGWLPIHTRITGFQEIFFAGLENSKVISSRSLEGKWQWAIEYTYTLQGVHLRGKAYFGETSNYIFKVGWESEIGWASKCKEVAETFVIY